jgi:copper transport protein
MVLLPLRQAHATIVRSDPPDLCAPFAVPHFALDDPRCATGLVLTVPPQAVHIWFSEPVSLIGSGVVIYAPSGKRIAAGPVSVTKNDVQVAVVGATEMGTYLVNWRVVSDDTHPAQGSFAFSVGAPSVLHAPGSVSPAGSVAPLGLALQVAARWLHFVGEALSFGVVLFSVIASARLPTVAARRLWRLVGAGVVVLLLAEPVALLGQSASFGLDAAIDPDVIGDVLTSSFGRSLSLRVGAAVLLWALLAQARETSKNAIIAVLALGAGLAFVDGASGHAGSSGPAWLTYTANAVHVGAMMTWVGGLVGLLVLWENADSDTHRASLARSFGRVAAVAFVLLALSGVGLGVQHTPSLASLGENLYGRFLLLKMVIVALAGGLALLALRAHVHEKPRWWAQELTAILAVLAFAGFLVSVAPPR